MRTNDPPIVNINMDGMMAWAEDMRSAKKGRFEHVSEEAPTTMGTVYIQAGLLMYTYTSRVPLAPL